MTDRQKQNLLQYLGYYTGQVDGQWGDQPRVATEAFQRDYQLTVDGLFGQETEKRILEVIASGEQPAKQAQTAPETGGGEDWWRDIRWFTPQEFACKCGRYHAPYCNGFPARPKERLVRIADELRERLGVPVEIVSGIRCPLHNKDSGGVDNSQHMDGTAADIHARGVSTDVVERTLDEIGGVRYHYHIQGSDNVHFDIPRQ